jgi:acylphosphatase
MDLNNRAHVVISGRVQGVFFRVETKRMAGKIGLTGWVRNRADGSVEALFEGPKSKVDEAITWCHRGAPMARVAEVRVDWQSFIGEFDTFSIIG